MTYCLKAEFGKYCKLRCRLIQMWWDTKLKTLQCDKSKNYPVALPFGSTQIYRHGFVWIPTSTSMMHKFIAHPTERVVIPCREMGPWISGGHQAPCRVSHPNSFGCVTGNESRRITSTQPKRRFTCTHAHTNMQKRSVPFVCTIIFNVIFRIFRLKRTVLNFYALSHLIQLIFIYILHFTIRIVFKYF